VVRDGALEARTAPFTAASLDVRIEAILLGESLLIDFTLPVAVQPTSAATPPH